ncbi:gastrula zinc finger protein XlCGF17.1-like [Culicoides brevitarsis]|uniref:gastrula zinc finger protein XlCGF17.1-like n=1 Tax=Culicoides brevitarsis TaxID=469753 RepID=UPI00307B5EFC
MESCRCCCEEKNELLDMKTTKDDKTQKFVVDCFVSITKLSLQEVEINTKICQKCHSELLQAFHFQQNALMAHFRLKNAWMPDLKPDFEELQIKIEVPKDEIIAESPKILQFKARKKRKPSSETLECRLKCDHCSKTFETKRYLTNHLLRKHFNNMKSHLCDNCGLRFLGISELRNHIRATHTNELPYSCHLCPRSYRSLQSLKVHLTSHSDVRAFVCETCSSSFKTRGALFNHRRLHQITNDPFICEICSSKFTTKLYYEKHLRSHSIEETVRCPVCNKCFKNQSILKLHARTHTGEMFRCNACPKEYNTKEKLSKHFLCSHSGQEKKFKCHLCSSAFYVNHKLNRHLRNVHKVEVTVDQRKIKKY